MRKVLCLAVFLCGASTYADKQFWVSVGSHGDPESAEQLREEASNLLGDVLSVSAAETSVGYFYRVVAGPFLSHDSAAYTLDRAHDAGYADAWVLATEDADSTFAASNYDDIEFDVLPRNELPADPQAPAAEATTSRLKLVEEAPEGYKLHKLHRD